MKESNTRLIENMSFLPNIIDQQTKAMTSHLHVIDSIS